MIDVLLSVRPRWCRKILKREKPVELRKSGPRIKGIFRVYLYETKQGRGAVVGECICWMVERDSPGIYSTAMVEGSCLSAEEIDTYANGRPVYGWYLAKITEYKHPRPLSDFNLQRAPQSWCYIKEVA
nr:MAG TPA: hypothetical protein [Caudoviricetes sp.]